LLSPQSPHPGPFQSVFSEFAEPSLKSNSWTYSPQGEYPTERLVSPTVFYFSSTKFLKNFGRMIGSCHFLWPISLTRHLPPSSFNFQQAISGLWFVCGGLHPALAFCRPPTPGAWPAFGLDEGFPFSSPYSDVELFVLELSWQVGVSFRRPSDLCNAC